MDIKIMVDEDKKHVSLHLEVKMNNQSGRYKVIHAKNWLEEKGYKLGRIVKSDIVQNKDEKEELCKGHWIFELKHAPEQTKAKKPEKAKVVKKKATRRPFTQPVSEEKKTEE